MSLPGRSIPYHFTPAEVQDFVGRHAWEPAMSGYLYTKQPPYGIIVSEDYGQILVWFDAAGVLHVVDVTNLAIAHQVQQAPFESPDSGLFGNMAQEFQKLFDQAAALTQLVPLAIAGLVAFQFFKRR